MKFVTFNLRCDRPQDGENQFICRQPLIVRVMKREQPDVICFQEVEPHMAMWLKKTLKDYYIIGCGRGKNLDGEQMTVAFRKEKYQLLEMRTFWLSETPTVPGSRYPDQSSCPRSCTDAVLMEEEGGRVFRVINTHLDHVGKAAREQGLKQVLGYAEGAGAFSHIPVILAGDFNAEPDSEELRPLYTTPGLTDVTKDIGVTYHGYGKADPPEQIDYIVLKGGLRCLSVRKWTEEENGVFLSDHYPVCAEIAWETESKAF
ncbi:MAG: endonuclease/exonuclease/phosphatase family protein [Clostridia bacterium]|nr:endonuclease/exonuclease/phosphatase family protein [Clostridia bacterium]